MSTVTFRDGVMASDSCGAAGGVRLFNMNKMWRLPRGCLVGICGDADSEMLLRIIADGEEGILGNVTLSRDELNDCGVAGEALVVTPTESVHYIQCGKKFCDHVLAMPANPSAPYWAIGHGKEIALGAMAWGASAEDAVECAALHSISTIVPVRRLLLHPVQIGLEELRGVYHSPTQRQATQCD